MYLKNCIKHITYILINIDQNISFSYFFSLIKIISTDLKVQETIITKFSIFVIKPQIVFDN